jgi:uncharacterized membrane protein
MAPDEQPQPSPGPTPPPDPAEIATLLRRIERLEAQVAALTHIRPATPAPIQLTTQSPTLPPSSAATTPALPSLATPTRTDSLETQFGTRVLSKVGVLLLLIGAAWFLKWAFDNRWIGPTGRILAGLAAGIGVVLWSERFRRRGFSAVSFAYQKDWLGLKDAAPEDRNETFHTTNHHEAAQ